MRCIIINVIFLQLFLIIFTGLLYISRYHNVMRYATDIYFFLSITGIKQRCFWLIWQINVNVKFTDYFY